MSDERFIRDGGKRNWKRWGALAPDVRQAGLIQWRTSAKGNKWIEYKGIHVVVYQIENRVNFGGATAYETAWRYSVNNNQRRVDYGTEAEAQHAALVEIGAVRVAQRAEGSSGASEASSPPPPLALPESDGSRRIKG